MTATAIEHIIGPRIGSNELARGGIQYGIPGFLLLVARVLILVSLFLPYWKMELVAPQYPDNLHMWAYVNHLAGDVAEINGLNHYIGMRPLEEAAQLERSIGAFALIGFVVLLEFAGWFHNRWAAIFAIPAILFPAVFLFDLHFWMSHFGQNLDPDAPLSSAIQPFVPPILGTGTVGQFKTIASAGPGLILTSIASFVIVAALYFHRRAYKPLVDAGKPE